MATHLEYVAGQLGDWSTLPCACARGVDHARPGSSALAAPVTAPTPVRSPRRMPHAVVHRLGSGARRLEALRSRAVA